MLNNVITSLIMPCYNEEKGLKAIFESIPSFIDEIIVVDNGSDDNSTQIAKKYNAVVLEEKKRGYGSAILKGLRFAKGEFVIIADSDASYPIASSKDICAHMLKGEFDFVSGCRFPLGNCKAMPFLNRISNYFISWLIRFLFRVRIIDSQSGMVFFRRGTLDKIKAQNRRMGFSQEFKIRHWLNPDIKCSEFHIPYCSRTGKAKFNKIRDGLSNLCDLLILWRELK